MRRMGLAAWTLGLPAMLAACTLEELDERELHAGAASAGAASGAGGGGAPTSGGASGSAGSGPARHCVYAGAEPEPGCETLVENPGFETDVSGWYAESG